MGNLDLKQAESVLAEAKSYGMIDSMPYEHKDRIGMAEELVQRARIQHDNFHGRSSEILAILFAAEVDGGTQSGKKSAQEEVEEKQQKTQENASERLGTSKEVSEKAERTKRAESALDLIEEDFTRLSDQQVRQLHSQFNAIASRASHKLVIEENDLQSCKLIADARRNELLAEHSDSKKSVALLDAEISDDKELKEWRARQYKHEVGVRWLKMERDVANSNVERLSREWTMRTAERDGSGQLFHKTQLRDNGQR